jgi:hypothetical protein
MRLVAAIVLGLGMIFLIFWFVGLPGISSALTLAIGVFGVLVGGGSLWRVNRARTRSEQARWRFLDR